MIQKSLSKEFLVRNLIKTLWNDSSTKDLEIICGGFEPRPTVFCHRPILALASPFIKSLVHDEGCCLIIPDYEPEVVEKLLRRVYLSNDDVETDDNGDNLLAAKVDELATLLGIRSTVVVDVTIDVNPADVKRETLESRLEQLRSFNSGLSITRRDDSGVVEVGVDVDVDVDADDHGDDFVEPAINFAIRSTKKLKRLGKLLKGSGGKIVVVKAPACIAAKKSRLPEEITDVADDAADVDNAVESDVDDDSKPQHAFINLEAISNKEMVPIKVKCWDCTKLITTTMKDFEDVITRIQGSIPNFTANYRCEDCLSRGGLPTEEEIETKKKERMKKRLELKRERRKTYNAKTSVKESLWKDNKKMEELKQQKLLCQFCGKQFSVVQGHLYWEHMNMHQNITPYRCHIEGCTFGTHSKPEFSLHMKKAHPPVGDEGVFQCDKCPLQSISQKNLAEHIRKFHDETSEKNVYECDQCFYRSASIQGLSQHKTRWHKSDSQKFTCQICNAKLGNRKSIYEHMRKIHNVLRACKFCDFKHQDCDMVRRHTQEVHRDQMPYACSLCLYCTNRQKFLQRHVETMHNESPRKKELQGHQLQQPDFDADDDDF